LEAIKRKSKNNTSSHIAEYKIQSMGNTASSSNTVQMMRTVLARQQQQQHLTALSDCDNTVLQITACTLKRSSTSSYKSHCITTDRYRLPFCTL